MEREPPCSFSKKQKIRLIAKSFYKREQQNLEDRRNIQIEKSRLDENEKQPSNKNPSVHGNMNRIENRNTEI